MKITKKALGDIVKQMVEEDKKEVEELERVELENKLKLMGL